MRDVFRQHLKTKHPLRCFETAYDLVREKDAVIFKAR
jgi:hypothetical protein